MPSDAGGRFAWLDPESVADDPADGPVTVSRAAFGFHAAIAVVLLALAGLAVGQGNPADAAVVAGMAGMVLVAGWAAGRIVARR